MSPRWRLTAGADVSPLVVARLTTILPEKYPGQDIVFQARVAAVNARVQVASTRDRWPLSLTGSYGRTWSYRSASRLDRTTLQIGVRVGIQP